MKKTVAVILSGGSGARLWPLSRHDAPKQFQAFTDDTSLLSHTVQRADALPTVSEIMVVCSAAHQALVEAHCAPYTDKPITYVLEPVARNTAAAIACAAAYLQTAHLGTDVCMLVLPSDHAVGQTDLFAQAIGYALAGADAGYLVTLGVAATHPETGYGYLEMGALLGVDQVYKVARFTEKPSLARAQAMLASGNYRWNSGMFVMRAALFLDELKSYEPGIYTACTQSVARAPAGAGHSKSQHVALERASLEACTSKSVDHAVFERSERVSMVSLDSAWTDLGSWAAVAELDERAAHSAAESSKVISIGAKHNYVRAQKMVALVGVSDLLVVDTPDALLISHHSRAQEVKDVVAVLDAQKSTLTQFHSAPAADAVAVASTLQSPRDDMPPYARHIVVQPHAHLPQPVDTQHARHWIVLTGQASITLDGKQLNSLAGQHLCIEKGQTCVVHNSSDARLEIVEVVADTR
jgi:mannose-1-phosphate guanylyltransferase / mannose-6-phosphate isomerase